MNVFILHQVEFNGQIIELSLTEFEAKNLLGKVVVRWGGSGLSSWSTRTTRDLHYTMVF